MKKLIFKKASYFIKTNQVEILSETENTISFQVKEYHVQFKYRKNEMICLCECSAGSFLKPCSHIIACLVYLSKIKWKD